MNLNYMYSLIAVIVLFLLAYVGVEVLGLQYVFGVIIPYLAIITFVAGFISRMMGWVRSPVPFRIPTTAGQEKSLPWIKYNKFDNPSTKFGVIVRMFLEIVFFRSLFRNTKFQVRNDKKPSYEMEKWLWLAALVFHWTFLVVLIRHLRLFVDPVPKFVDLVEKVDGFFQIGLPVVMMSGILLLVAATYLFLRRVLIPHMRYISLAADFFPLFLIIGIAASGILMRYFIKVDVIGAKEFSVGLFTLHPTIPEGMGSIFYVHLFFVSVLLAYFPYSKLMHLGGIFLSPTRNLANNSRVVRHVNPWNYPVKVHTYDEYEDEFRDKMKEAGLPVEKE